MSKGNATTFDATVYVCAASGSPTGPFAWCARVVTFEGVSELIGHGGGHFTRLQIVAATAAFNAIPERSSVQLISSDAYLVNDVIGKLEALTKGGSKTKKRKNADLIR